MALSLTGDSFPGIDIDGGGFVSGGGGGSTDLTSLNNKTQKLDANGDINNSITTSQTTFTNDQEIVSKKIH